jgi:hydroxymethylbilane synthase
MAKEKVIVGTRGSRLALVQTESVISALKKNNPDTIFEVKKIVTGGDRDVKTQLDRVEGIGFFTKELEEALTEGTIDLAVHSLKDMPTIIPGHLMLAATLERADPRDVIVTRGESLDDLKAGARIGTSSPRRSIQLSRLRSDLVTAGIRGNIDTRLNKIGSEVDGVIMAGAALIRLGWEEKITQYLPLDEFIPSAGQGAIAIEMRRGEEYLSEMVSRINHSPTWVCTSAERIFLSALGGGCRAPIAVLATLNGEHIHIDGMAASIDGSKVLTISGGSEVSQAEKTAVKMAEELLDRGATEFIEEATANRTW